MKVLLVGDGAREHIIAEKIAQDAELYAVMSKKNPAIAKLSKKYWICDINSAQAVSSALYGEKFDICFSSPDATLAAGVSDALSANGAVASPTKAAARIEWDKAFARNLFVRHKIPGSPRIFFAKSIDEAKDAFKQLNNDVAVKPLGLTGGKGVKISGEHFKSFEGVSQYISELISKDGTVLLEEKLIGEEFTLQAFSDGKHLAFMPPVQDHKRAFCGDCGANTGGMGSYSTGKLLPFMQQSDLEDAKKIMQLTIAAMEKDGCLFKGVLYGQFMATAHGVKVIEYNARFGDPEAMNVLSLLQEPLSNVLQKIIDGKLESVKFEDNKSTVVKYLVPDGYPDKPKGDQEVKVDEKAIAAAGARIYFASVYEKDSKVFTTRSRAFGIVGVAGDIGGAEKTAEASCSSVSGPVWHREDIGTAALLDKRIEHMKRLRG